MRGVARLKVANDEQQFDCVRQKVFLVSPQAYIGQPFVTASDFTGDCRRGDGMDGAPATVTDFTGSSYDLLVRLGNLSTTKMMADLRRTTVARKKTSPAEDLIDLVSLMPWWAGVGLAVIAYVVLHRLATPVAATAIPPGQIADVMVRTIGASLASIGQYLVPLLCLAGAGVSSWRRHQRRALVSNVSQAKGADALDGMSWQEFEILVGEAFRLQGYRVAETGGGGADGGVDLVLSKGGEKFLVQCKQWKAYKVGVEVVRELYGVMAAKGATGGFVVTSGSFSNDAKDFADGRNVTLIDGHRLFGLIKQARDSLASGTRGAAQPSQAAAARSSHESVHAASCPTCGSEMVKRTAKKGANAGGQFLGCSTYPSCRGIRSLG